VLKSGLESIAKKVGAGAVSVEIDIKR